MGHRNAMVVFTGSLAFYAACVLLGITHPMTPSPGWTYWAIIIVDGLCFLILVIPSSFVSRLFAWDRNGKAAK